VQLEPLPQKEAPAGGGQLIGPQYCPKGEQTEQGLQPVFAEHKLQQSVAGEA
jgi:hypothetical protein